MVIQPVVEALTSQLELLFEWNKKNVDSEPEQVRKNLETISSVIYQTFRQ